MTNRVPDGLLKKIDVVIGTRPEAIKMAPVVAELKERKNCTVRIIATGQHTDMLTQALDYFSLFADVNLGIMKKSQSLDYIISAVIQGVGEVFDDVRPDAVLVHGDTTTTFAAALSAFYRQIPIGHVEAGLRSEDMTCPFPEEMNRVLTDRIATWWFAPTVWAEKNLLREGVCLNKIYVTGNTVIDALYSTVEKNSPPKAECLKQLVDQERFLLLTAHRRESWGKPLESICSAVLEILKRHGEYRVLVPMHKNPSVRETMRGEIGRAHV